MAQAVLTLSPRSVERIIPQDAELLECARRLAALETEYDGRPDDADDLMDEIDKATDHLMADVPAATIAGLKAKAERFMWHFRDFLDADNADQMERYMLAIVLDLQGMEAQS
ncbi:MAG TPA: hypothetical protein VH684_31410 [Xanthobacteraceae bacterium]